MNRYVIAALAGICAGTLTGIATATPQTRQLPGYWEAVTTGLTARPTTAHTCVTAEGDAAGDFLREQQARGCRFSRQVYAGGRIDIAGTCPNGSATMTGNYTPTSAAFTVRSTVVIGGKAMPMNFSSRTRRIAATCPAGEE